MKWSVTLTVALGMMLSSQAHAASCKIDYNYPCQGRNSFDAFVYSYYVNCTTGEIITAKFAANEKCAIDSSRYRTRYSVRYTCEELGWKSTNSNQYYAIVFNSAGSPYGNFFVNFCPNGQNVGITHF
ncbi:MAG: hypothetical protein AB7F86_17130 [Bdellovibrionales bacterium]